jgi:hypothetical protein
MHADAFDDLAPIDLDPAVARALMNDIDAGVWKGIHNLALPGGSVSGFINRLATRHGSQVPRPVVARLVGHVLDTYARLLLEWRNDQSPGTWAHRMAQVDRERNATPPV